MKITGHFRTADGCERTIEDIEYSRFYALPFQFQILRDEDMPFSTPRLSWGKRMYKVVSVDVHANIAHYEEVYEP